MKRIFVALAACLFISGCVMNAGEKISNMEARLETIETRLSSIETKMDTVEQKQVALEGLYHEMEKRKAPVTVSALSNQDIQTALKNAGVYEGAVDGRMGPATDRAIRKFQEANGLKADGVVGTKTKIALAKYLKQESVN